MSKVILVTGANSGIGFELTRLLAERGHTVYLGARNPVAGQEALDKLHADGLKSVKFVELDVTNLTTIVAAKEVIQKAEGRLDVLVNNAGISCMDRPQAASTVELAVIREAFEPNFFGLIQTTTTLLPLIRAALNGVILNVSTDMASNTLQARPEAGLHLAAYNTSKAAANSYTIALSHDLRKGIKVNAVTPGYTSTKLNSFGEGGKSVRAGAEILLPWALLDKDGPTGLFIDQHGNDSPW